MCVKRLASSGKGVSQRESARYSDREVWDPSETETVEESEMGHSDGSGRERENSGRERERQKKEKEGSCGEDCAGGVGRPVGERQRDRCLSPDS